MALPASMAARSVNRPSRRPIRIRWWVFAFMFAFAMLSYMQRNGVAAAGPHLDADIAKVHEWLGHANIATTRIYDRRRSRPGDSPTFKVSYF